ncbi:MULTISPECIES: LLM class flavin-dependent oxidoreductase [Pseudonocardia]|uniref:Dimethyl-sulfide monooxygenase n=2 Tax=Pseudonocardia TaxID=1847 RepID=A0A1Y2ML15_PSEAH|nr:MULTISPECIES: NtaA/DmoA family FMN-dependent monooxygenase [Pseudonocardia]OSY35842.1 Dimethyl-sulfide monooxygenase [Pseudonocardia autotrophica]TDN73136.1 FMN-dependent oxidoreductase (nitrilotriacetate monooxygenase family) [Pseudonocardia autotrophica]BBG03855.1 N5,N10-methylene tetrahydromethanopterin reductase [Pseudonocardia autotrophica]GEC27346.1 N5,N10-methylene tetrahydromethanopterin reductase [Pseudonocardia saturnea]
MTDERPGKGDIILSAFDMHCVVHQNPGMWLLPGDRTHQYTDIEYWVQLAQLLEEAGFDALFIADVLGFYDIYGGNRDAALRTAAQAPVGDPLVTIPAMSAATKRIGFGATVSLTYELPYKFAKTMTTLDHLTKGRVAWNIVTSYQQSAAVNLGLERQIEHDERYEMADEFMEVCYKLWESSWEEDAVVRDHQRGIYTDPAKVHDIAHKGKYYSVPGAHLSEPSPQRTPFLFQAGASARGRRFASTHSEAVFLIGVNPQDTRTLVDQYRMMAAEQGRDPRSLKVLIMLTPIVAPTDEEAQEKLAQIQGSAQVDAALALWGGWTGIDLQGADPDAPLEQFQGDGIRAFSDMLTRVDSELVWTPRRLAEWLCVGGMSASVVGSPQTVVDHMQEWIDVADVDGFNIARVTNFGTFEDFRDLITPELRRRGMIPEDPDAAGHTTIRSRLLGRDRLRDDHPGAAFRPGAPERVSPAPRTTTEVGTDGSVETVPRRVGLVVTLRAKPEKREELADWLREMQAHAQQETGTTTWYAYRVDDDTFGIYDTFPGQQDREAHIHGEIVKSLRVRQQELLAEPPKIRQVDLLAVKQTSSG